MSIARVLNTSTLTLEGCACSTLAGFSLVNEAAIAGAEDPNTASEAIRSRNTVVSERLDVIAATPNPRAGAVRA